MYTKKLLLILLCLFSCYSMHGQIVSDSIKQKRQITIGITSFRAYDARLNFQTVTVKANKFVYYIGVGHKNISNYDPVKDEYVFDENSPTLIFKEKNDWRFSFLAGWQYYPVDFSYKRCSFYLDYNFHFQNFDYIQSIDSSRGRVNFYNNYIGIGANVKFLKRFYLLADAGLTIYTAHQKSSLEEYLNVRSRLSAKVGLGV